MDIIFEILFITAYKVITQYIQKTSFSICFFNWVFKKLLLALLIVTIETKQNKEA